jgi:hypothetical protein
VELVDALVADTLWENVFLELAVVVVFWEAEVIEVRELALPANVLSVVAENSDAKPSTRCAMASAVAFLVPHCSLSAQVA